MNQSTSNSPLHLRNWDNADLPVFRAEAPTGTRSLRALADAEELAYLVPLVASNIVSSDRKAAIAIVHFTASLALDILLSSATLDGIGIEATADQLGLVFEEDGTLSGVWIADTVDFYEGILAVPLGEQLSSLLKPIVAAVRARWHISRRGLDLVLFDAIRRRCRQMENRHVAIWEGGWGDELLTAMGDTRIRPPHTITLPGDDGEPVELEMRRVCCVLATCSTPTACPTCPQHSDADRRRYADLWLRSMDDQEFLCETGRRRVTSQLS